MTLFITLRSYTNDQSSLLTSNDRITFADSYRPQSSTRAPHTLPILLVLAFICFRSRISHHRARSFDATYVADFGEFGIGLSGSLLGSFSLQESLLLESLDVLPGLKDGNLGSLQCVASGMLTKERRQP